MSTDSTGDFKEMYGGDPSCTQFLYNPNGWWPWFSDPPITGIILVFFFLLWNSIMSVMMVSTVLGPLSRGICKAEMCILVVFPHWYIGILIPFLLGGLIPGFMTLMPYVYAICCTLHTDTWGCSAAA
jgi:hypothetical protein